MSVHGANCNIYTADDHSVIAVNSHLVSSFQSLLISLLSDPHDLFDLTLTILQLVVKYN